MKILIALSALVLSGCSVGDYHYSKESLKRVDMTFTGIPTILGAGSLGSPIPLTPEYSLTAAHVAKFSLHRVKAWHPQCDLAVIYHDNSDLKQSPVFRNSNIGDRVNYYGYSFISAMPVASSGVNLINTGIDNSYNKRGCVAVASNAGVVKGMSGGPVYNASDDSIAGVIVGYSGRINDKKTGEKLYSDVSLYIPYAGFEQWLTNAINS